MRDLPFIAGAYVLATVIPIGYALSAALRARQIKRRLAAVEARPR
jgi:hypothetical protein